MVTRPSFKRVNNRRNSKNRRYLSYNGKNDENYKDVQGFCELANMDEISEHEYILTPGRYVGI